MGGLKALGVRQLRHAEQVDLVHHDQGGPPPPSDRNAEYSASPSLPTPSKLAV